MEDKAIAKAQRDNVEAERKEEVKKENVRELQDKSARAAQWQESYAGNYL
ncbi:hypothetical protein OQH61_03550 [Helicobacter sp. MIT 21-1697]|nr:hypothetical protein [Helicobacter sp. MIT 21-1697]MCX2716809.1 hypothetical protein [Helicobacter sp. MIT 21-1697]